MGLFDKLLNDAAEADREVLKKYPQIKEWDDKLAEWETWKANHWDPNTGMTKNALAALQQKDQELEALRLMQGTEMTWDEMKGNVESLLKNSGVVTKAQLEADILPKLQFAKPSDIESLAQKQQNFERGAEMTLAKTTHLPVKYFREFGDLPDAPEFTIEGLFKHMSETKQLDPQAAYDSLVQPLRAKKAEMLQQKREEDLKKQVREETLKEVTLKGGALPVDDKGSAPEMGMIQRRLAEKKKTETNGAPKLTPGTLGDGTGANDAYQAWLSGQAGRVQ